MPNKIPLNVYNIFLKTERGVVINFIQICPLELFEQIIECDKLALSRLTCVRPMFNALIEAYVKKKSKGFRTFCR